MTQRNDFERDEAPGRPGPEQYDPTDPDEFERAGGQGLPLREPDAVGRERYGQGPDVDTSVRGVPQGEDAYDAHNPATQGTTSEALDDFERAEGGHAGAEPSYDAPRADLES